MIALKKISELFIVKYGINLELNKLLKCKKSNYDSINFVSRTEKNNGISAFVKKRKDIIPNEANTISVAAGGSVLASFYQPEPYYSGRDLYVLNPIRKMTPVEMIYYSMCIQSNRYRYNYDRQANKTLKNILVPSEIPKEFSDVSMNEMNTIDNKSMISKNIELNTEMWEYFIYDTPSKGIFKIEKGKRLTKKDQSDGVIPYVSSSSLNNGVDNYIGNGFTDENCITFACYGSIGEVFYQNEKAWVSDNANVFYLRDKKLNPFIALFLVTVLRLEQYRFSYGMTGKKERLQNFKIKLPVDINGNPDWKFMEDYIKSLPYSSSIN